MFDLVSVYGNKEERYWLITEGEGVGMDLRDKASPDSSCPRQGYLPLDQVAQDLIQPGLQHCQVWSIHNPLRHSIPLSHHPHSKKFFLI